MIIEKLIDNVEYVIGWMSYCLLNHDMTAHVDLETAYAPDDQHILVGTDGGLLTVLRLDGCTQLIEGKNRDKLNIRIYEKFKAYFDGDSHYLNFWFESNPDRTARYLQSLTTPAMRTAKRLNLRIEDIILDQGRRLAQTCTYEDCLIAIWTDPSALPPSLIKAELQDKGVAVGKAGGITFRDAQNPFVAMTGLHDRHASVVDAVEQDLRSFGLIAEKVEKHEVVQLVKTMYDQETSEDWRPHLPGDKMMARSPEKTPEIDVSHLFYPSLARQIVSRRAIAYRTKTGLEAMRIGKMIYSALLFDMYPQDVYDFSVLLKRIDRQIPWRINFTIEPNGLKRMGTTRFLLSFFGFIGKNKEIRLAFSDLEKAVKNGEPNVRLRIALATWASDEKKLETNYTILTRAVQGWGCCGTTNDAGDPVAGVVSSMPIFTKSNIATAVAAPLFDVIKMLPTTRPASPWRTGTVLFRTPDGKVFPFTPGSSLEMTWIYLFFAPPGSGKSVLLNRIALAFCLGAGHRHLPFVAIIDVGPSSTGVIDMIRSGLSKADQHLAGKYMLRMVRECAINSFDTQPGCRFPTQHERNFLIELLSMLGTPAGESTPYANVGELSGFLVDEIYQRYSDRENGQPKRYEARRDADVDAALKEIGFTSDDHTIWWEVVDALFKHGRLHAATRAQRYAVPVLPDLVEVIKSNKIRDIYEAASGRPALISSGETLLDAMTRIIISACREYPILANETQFDLGDTRVFTIDLEQVVGDGPEGEKRTAICFMLAKNISARNFFLNPRMVQELYRSSPVQYHEYHAARAKEYYETPKFLLLDELHNAGKAKSEAFITSLERDGRQGRKNNLLLALSSQLVDDFPPPLVSMATGQFILRSPDPETTEKLTEKFKLNEETVRFLEHECLGPSEKGANFVGIFSTKKGRFVQGLTNQLGGIELWGLSTTSEDMALRNRLYALIPPAAARALLAERFPGGSAKAEIERRKNKLTDTDNADVIEQLAQELVNK